MKDGDTFEFYGYEAIVGLSASKHGDIWVVKKWGGTRHKSVLIRRIIYWGGLPGDYH